MSLVQAQTQADRAPTCRQEQTTEHGRTRWEMGVGVRNGKRMSRVVFCLVSSHPFHSITSLLTLCHPPYSQLRRDQITQPASQPADSILVFPSPSGHLPKSTTHSLRLSSEIRTLLQPKTQHHPKRSVSLTLETTDLPTTLYRQYHAYITQSESRLVVWRVL